MTIDKHLKLAILGRQGVLTASETAKLCGVSESTVYNVWHEAPPMYQRFRDPFYNQVLASMHKVENSPFIEGMDPIGMTPRELDIAEYLAFYEEYGAEVVQILREHYAPEAKL